MPVDQTQRIKPVRSENDHRAALAEIDRLMGAEPGSLEGDRLEVLSILVAEFERKTHPVAQPDPVEFLTFAMQAQGRSQADLAQVLGSRSRASEVLARRRLLSADMVSKISKAWGLSKDVLSLPYAIATGAKHRLRRAALAAGAFVLACGVALAGTFTIYGQDLPDTATLVTYRPADIRRLGPNGEFVEYRRFVPLSDIPPHVIKAFLAAEDQDYFQHDGYSMPAILRATMQSLVNLGTGRPPSGGATITQQVAKNVLLAGQPRSVERKIREIILARRIESTLTKDQILELYLNSIYFGGYAYGIGAGASQYFLKRPDQLTVAEAAYLAALPKAPNDYRLDVQDNHPRAKERRDWVLARMAQDGLITVSAARFAQAEPLLAKWNQ